MTDLISTPDEQSDGRPSSPTNGRHCPDRRSGKDRRADIRFQYDRRNNHGRRSTDKDLWKESLKN